MDQINLPPGCIHIDTVIGGSHDVADEITGDDVFSTLTEEGKNLYKRCLRTIVMGNTAMRRRAFREAIARFSEALLLDENTTVDGGGGIPFKGVTAESPNMAPHAAPVTPEEIREYQEKSAKADGTLPGGAVLLRDGRLHLYVNRGIAHLHLGHFKEAEADGWNAHCCHYRFKRALYMLDHARRHACPMLIDGVEDLGDHDMLIQGTPLAAKKHGPHQMGYVPAASECIWCGLRDVDNLMRCAACREVLYCGRACQKNHWKLHKKTCTKAVTA